jgi:hypothetical protein
MPQRRKKALNWTAVMVSGLVGVAALARFGSYPVFSSGVGKEQLYLLSVAALVHLLAALCALLNKRQLAALIILASVPVFSAWAIRFRASSVFEPYESRWYYTYAWLAVLSVVLGAYWLFSFRRRWPTVLTRPLSVRVRASVVCGALTLIGASDVVITFIDALRPWPESTRQCGVAGVFSQSTFVRDAAFTAHVIRAGHQIKISDRWVGYWALVSIQEQFTGWHLPRLAILTEGVFHDGDDYFVDGRRPKGLLTRFLPIVEMDICNRTGLLSDAGIPLRLLRSTFPRNDVRIIGRVDRWLETRQRQPYELQEYVLVRGAQAAITGPGGTIIATTDEGGIYSADGLPPGKYSVRLQTNGGSQSVMALSDWSCDLKPGEVADYSFSIR